AGWKVHSGERPAAVVRRADRAGEKPVGGYRTVRWRMRANPRSQSRVKNGRSHTWRRTRPRHTRTARQRQSEAPTMSRFARLFATVPVEARSDKARSME